jgi:hypothetical protein
VPNDLSVNQSPGRFTAARDAGFRHSCPEPLAFEKETLKQGSKQLSQGQLRARAFSSPMVRLVQADR